MASILTYIGLNFIFLTEETHKEFGLLTVNPGLIIWTIVIFVLVLLVLKKYAWKPLLNALHNREDSIKNALDNAEKLNQEAKVLMEQNQKNLEEASRNAMKIINDARELGKKERDEIINKANDETRKMVDRAKQDIQNEKESALEQMRDEIADLVIKTAEKVIDENLDEQKQKKILDEYLTKVNKN